MISAPSVVHVSVHGFFGACRAQAIEAIVSATHAFDEALARHAHGWVKPSADEAVLVGAPWRGRAPLDWAEGLKADVSRSLGLSVSVGIGGSRFAARTCARLASPDGILLWMDGREDCLIGGLPLEEVDELRDEQLARLRARGVKTVDELARLDGRTSRELLGSESGKLIGLVRGIGHEATVARRPRQELARLSRRLARRLEKAERRARGLELRITYQDGAVVERYGLLSEASAQPKALLQVAERLFSVDPGRAEPIVGIALSATGLTGAGGQNQLHLFGGPPQDIVVCVGRSSAPAPEDPSSSRRLTAAVADGYPHPTFPGGTVNEETLDPARGDASVRGVRRSRFGRGRQLDRLHF